MDTNDNKDYSHKYILFPVKKIGYELGIGTNEEILVSARSLMNHIIMMTGFNSKLCKQVLCAFKTTKLKLAKLFVLHDFGILVFESIFCFNILIINKNNV